MSVDKQNAAGEVVRIALTPGGLWMTAVTLMRLFLGAWMIVSGYSYWAQHFGLVPGFPQPLGALPASSQMLVTMIEVGLFNFVKTCEIVGGICLVLNVFVPTAIALLLPISGIVFFNAIFLNHRTDRLFDVTYMGVSCLYMNVIVALAYIRYYVPMLSFRSEPGSLRDLRLLSRVFDARDESRSA